MGRRRSKKISWSFRPLLAGLFVVLICGLAGWGGWTLIQSVKSARMFRVRAVFLSPELNFIQRRHLRSLVGESIFDVDLKAVHRRLERQYPQIERMHVIRQFPDRIVVAARKRDPFALCLLGDRQLVLDRQGIVLAFEPSRLPAALPKITGLKAAYSPALGKPLRIREVSTALSILDAFEDEELIVNQDVRALDVSHPSSIRLELSNQMNILLEPRHVPEKMKQLGVLLSQADLEGQNIGTIDLRFKEPVLREK